MFAWRRILNARRRVPDARQRSRWRLLLDRIDASSWLNGVGFRICAVVSWIVLVTKTGFVTSELNFVWSSPFAITDTKLDWLEGHA
ncbi:hypothetical protein EJB05_12729 [Eragrostis curvula]|uniref:Uncharacterized protein n=1 Tax=Eragrostis curvula TaxID=38414 RepID=A0A5J9VUK8_9POAL|nr:hypothetical protein EJB05_12729 [Eragrostis curvula]